MRKIFKTEVVYLSQTSLNKLNNVLTLPYTYLKTEPPCSPPFLLKSLQYLSQPARSQKTGKQGRYSSLQTEQKSQQPPIFFPSQAYALVYCYSWLQLSPFACITYASRAVTLQRQIRAARNLPKSTCTLHLLKQ